MSMRRLATEVDQDDNKQQSVFHNAVQKTLESEPTIVNDDGGNEPKGSDPKDDDYDDLEDFDVILGEDGEDDDKPPEKPAPPIDPNVASLAQSVATLAESLKPQKPPVQRKGRAKLDPVDPKVLEKEFNEKFHETDNPFELVMSTANKMIGGTLAQQNLELQKMKKDMLRNDPKYAVVLNNYEDEIEGVIDDLPAAQQSHPDAYKYACDQMLIRHFEDIQTMQAEEVEKKRNAVTTRPGATKTVGATQQGGGQGDGKKRTVRATVYEQNLARAFGISLADAVQRNRSK